MLLTFVLLGMAIIAVWLPDFRVGGDRRWPLWQSIFVASLVSALAVGLLRWPGLAAIAALWLAALAASRSSDRVQAAWWTAAACFVALALATHRMPGFVPAVVDIDIRLSPDSAVMTLRANFDKGAAGLILLAYFCRRIERPSELPRVMAVGLGIGLLTALVVTALVAATGAIRLDPKLPAIAPAWLAINLLLTCLMEEALFRGILQERLARALAHRPRWRHAAIAGPALLFGLVHFGGGPALIVAATLAGAGYGVAYARTGRIEAAVLAHFTLNSAHFFGFTYPYAVR